MTENRHVIGHLCVFRYAEDKPWMPIGLLRNEIREGGVGQKERLVEYLLTYSKSPEARRGVRRWAKEWMNIHSKKRTDIYTAPDGRQYTVLSMRVTPYYDVDNFIDPER